MVIATAWAGGTSFRLESSSMQPALQALIEKYCLTLEGQMRELQDLLSGFDQSEIDQPFDVAPATELVHRIAGIAGSMGYPAVSDAAAALERMLRIVEKTDGVADAETVGNVTTLYSALQLAAGMVKPETSTLFSADLDWLDGAAPATRERA